MEYYTTEKNDDILKFAGKWMDLENIILTEVTQTKTTIPISTGDKGNFCTSSHACV